MAEVPLPVAKPSEKPRPIGVMPNYAFNKTQFNELDFYKPIEEYLDPVAKLGWHAYASGQLELKKIESERAFTQGGEFLPSYDKGSSTRKSRLTADEFNKDIQKQYRNVDSSIDKYPNFKSSRDVDKTYATFAKGDLAKGRGLKALIHELRHAGMNYMLNNLQIDRPETPMEEFVMRRSFGMDDVVTGQFPVEEIGGLVEEDLWEIIDAQYMPDLIKKTNTPPHVAENMMSDIGRTGSGQAVYRRYSSDSYTGRKTKSAVDKAINELYGIADKHLNNMNQLKFSKDKRQFKQGMERLGKTKTPNMIKRERGIIERFMDFLFRRDKDLYKGNSIDDQMKALKVG
tara:strand:+ start:44 stop:1072 length:1029 start_codon:yes stop_codon:yes gene_type:complete